MRKKWCIFEINYSNFFEKGIIIQAKLNYVEGGFSSKKEAEKYIKDEKLIGEYTFLEIYKVW